MIDLVSLGAMTKKLREVPLWILFILGIVIAGNLVSVVAIDIHPDEAYYWAWSVYPDYSYFDHPPMVAWMIWLVGKLFGINDFTLRLPAVLSWAVSAFLVFRIGGKLYGEQVYGWLAAAIFCMLPVFQAASHIVTPDSPLLLFTALAFYYLLDASRSPSVRNWVWVGVVTGLGMLSKYNAVLIPLIVFAGLLATQNGRRQLMSKSPWMAVVAAVVVFLPVIYWNYKYDWLSFSFQLDNGMSSEFSLKNVGTFVGGQLGAALIWIMLLMMAATYRWRQKYPDDRSTYVAILIAGFWVPLLFFGYAAGTKPGQVNWPAMAYLPGSILLAGMLGKYAKKANGENGEYAASPGARVFVASLLVFSCLLAVTMVNIFRFPVQAKQIGLGILPTNTQLSDTFGWSELKTRIQAFKAERGLKPDCTIYVSTRYIWGSLVYQFRDVEQIAMLPEKSVSQYKFWTSNRIIDEHPACMVVERLPHNQSDYKKTRKWEGIGDWVLVETTIIPTSDTPRVYGLYVPANIAARGTK